MAKVKIELLNEKGKVVETRELKTEDVLACYVYGELDKKLKAQEKKIKKLCK